MATLSPLTDMQQELISQVQHNCDISDANHAGNYTLCIYLLKMREYYRWIHALDFSDCKMVPKTSPKGSLNNSLGKRPMIHVRKKQALKARLTPHELRLQRKPSLRGAHD